MKTVLLLGAGATRATATVGTAEADSPPLDRSFFIEANKSGLSQTPVPSLLSNVQNYVREEYGYDLFELDSLERVMNIVFTDVTMGSETAALAMNNLTRLFQKRIQVTTQLHATDAHPVRRIVENLLSESLEPQELTIITFNQDLEAERALDLLADERPGLFALPDAYQLGDVKTLSGAGRGGTFDHVQGESDVTLLKLHGSLNWYRRSRDRLLKSKQLASASISDLFVGLWRNPNRQAFDSKQSKGRSKWYVFPIIVPPVGGKGRSFPPQITDLWRVARDRLTEAERLLVFGYSCPTADIEASNLLRAATRQIRPKVTVIDPNPGAVARYHELTDTPAIAYFHNHDAFLAATSIEFGA